MGLQLHSPTYGFPSGNVNLSCHISRRQIRCHIPNTTLVNSLVCPVALWKCYSSLLAEWAKPWWSHLIHHGSWNPSRKWSSRGRGGQISSRGLILTTQMCCYHYLSEDFTLTYILLYSHTHTHAHALTHKPLEAPWLAGWMSLDLFCMVLDYIGRSPFMFVLLSCKPTKLYESAEN